ncbi:hypothetical protein ACH5RR_037654 [Cinchona calisaya]|uniref:VQ domain-containing protein n=1 Tax=Cinchona calisaya TaxID=153742 RepID=A0ABD2YAI7_9GENT
MEIASRIQEGENPSPLSSNSNSPNRNNGSSSSSSSLQLLPTPPLTPKPNSTTISTTRSESINNPYPTTFVQADTTTFKQVVQMLTGTGSSSESPKQTSKPACSSSSIPPIRSTGQKKQGFKLYERRNSLKNGLMMISPLIPSGGFPQNSTSFSPRKAPAAPAAEILSPSILDFPSLVLSPVTPLNEDPFNNNKSSSSPSLGSCSSSSEEEKAIAEKKFYLLPSPRTLSERDSAAEPPQLLPLFPVTSPRVSGSSS